MKVLIYTVSLVPSEAEEKLTRRKNAICVFRASFSGVEAADLVYSNDTQILAAYKEAGVETKRFGRKPKPKPSKLPRSKPKPKAAKK